MFIQHHVFLVVKAPQLKHFSEDGRWGGRRTSSQRLYGTGRGDGIRNPKFQASNPGQYSDHARCKTQRAAMSHGDLKEQLLQLEARMDVHDETIQKVFDAINHFHAAKGRFPAKDYFRAEESWGHKLWPQDRIYVTCWFYLNIPDPRTVLSRHFIFNFKYISASSRLQQYQRVGYGLVSRSNSISRKITPNPVEYLSCLFVFTWKQTKDIGVDFRWSLRSFNCRFRHCCALSINYFSRKDPCPTFQILHPLRRARLREKLNPWGLIQKGRKVIPETGRKIIQEQVEANGNALPWADKAKFRDLMVERDIAQYAEAQKQRGLIFFDRGIPDSLGYSRLENIPSSKILEMESSSIPTREIFMTPPGVQSTRTTRSANRRGGCRGNLWELRIPTRILVMRW